jgi:uncharacterized protein involved in exopolysaccharide biosynthesis
LYRHKAIFLTTLITILVLVGAYAFTRPATYSGAMTIVFSNQVTHSPYDVQGGSNYDRLNQMTGQFQTLVRTQKFMSDALTDFSGKPYPLKKPIDVNNSKQLLGVQNSISISTDGTQSILVNVTYDDPQDTSYILVGVVQRYLKKYLDERTSYYASQKAFLEKELILYSQQLSKSERDLSTWKKAHPNGTLNGIESSQSQLADLLERASDAQVQVQSLQQRIALLETQIASTPKSISVSSQEGVGSTALQDKLDALRAEIDDDINVKQLTSDHPIVVALNKQANQLQQMIDKRGYTSPKMTTRFNPVYESLQNQMLLARADLETQRTSAENIKNRIGSTQNLVSKGPDYETELAARSRNIVTYSQNYDSLAEQFEQAKMNLQVNQSNAGKEFQSYLTMQPTKLQSKRQIFFMFGGGIFVAFFAAFTLAFFAEWFDKSLRDPYSTSLLLPAPLLTVAPEYRVSVYGEQNYVDALSEKNSFTS